MLLTGLINTVSQTQLPACICWQITAAFWLRQWAYIWNPNQCFAPNTNIHTFFEIKSNYQFIKKKDKIVSRKHIINSLHLFFFFESQTYNLLSMSHNSHPHTTPMQLKWLHFQSNNNYNNPNFSTKNPSGKNKNKHKIKKIKSHQICFDTIDYSKTI